MRKMLTGFVILVILSVGAVYLSPWPGVLVIRAIFDRGAAQASRMLEARVPADTQTATYIYRESEGLALDIYRPPNRLEGAPVVIWIHGGGFVSGRREDVANYLKILAGQGFVVVNVDYTIAPEARYPAPVRQVNAALAFLDQAKERLSLDTSHLVLAGDSAGAQIAAQVAATIANPAYAARLGIEPGIRPNQIVGALLFCGVYDISGMGQGGGIFSQFVAVTGWAYSGRRNWREDTDFATMNVAPWLTPAFPPAFVSAGNGDPLGPQSLAFAKALTQTGGRVETLFFPADHAPSLGHEYQFDLSTPAGEDALAKVVAWLKGL